MASKQVPWEFLIISWSNRVCWAESFSCTSAGLCIDLPWPLRPIARATKINVHGDFTRLWLTLLSHPCHELLEWPPLDCQIWLSLLVFDLPYRYWTVYVRTVCPWGSTFKGSRPNIAYGCANFFGSTTGEEPCAPHKSQDPHDNDVLWLLPHDNVSNESGFCIFCTLVMAQQVSCSVPAPASMQAG